MRPARPHLARLLLVLPLLLGAVACSDDSAGSSNASTSAENDVQGDGTEAAGTDATDGEAAGVDGGSGTGRATLSVDGETWTFDQIMCAFGEDEIGIDGAEFNMAARDGSIALYAAIDPGHSYIELNDIETMDDGGLNWSTDGAGAGDPTIEVDGKSVSATATFVHRDAEWTETLAEGTLEATCP